GGPAAAVPGRGRAGPDPSKPASGGGQPLQSARRRLEARPAGLGATRQNGRRIIMIPPQSLGPAYEYWLDACQRGILFLDILRQRGNTVHAHEAETAPNVLTFDPELVMHGRDLPRPVNYGLVRIVPPPGVTIDSAKPPFVVVDPRAGHGPG